MFTKKSFRIKSVEEFYFSTLCPYNDLAYFLVIYPFNYNHDNNYGLYAIRFNSTTVKKENIFFDQEVQNLLKRLTGLNYDKVFRARKLGKDPKRPIYQFMTEAELEEAT